VVNTIPATPTASNGGPFCEAATISLSTPTVAGATYAWTGPNGFTSALQNPTRSNATLADAGTYSIAITVNGCTSAAGTTTVVVNPTPATPVITPGGPTTFCAGGSVTLTSSSASGNQWRLNGSPIGGATGQQHVASVAGNYSVTVTASGCSSAPSAVTSVVVNPNPNATITAPASVLASSTGNAASVANAGVGATYAWLITNGSITAGVGTSNVTFSAGAVGTLTLQVTVSVNGCSDTKSANVNINSSSITSVAPPAGKASGGNAVTITGTGFVNGATITFGGAAATNVVVVSSTTITAKTPAHAVGAVNVTITNPDTSSATRTNGYTYLLVQFDANGDNVIDPADIFYLVNYLFLTGQPPAGASGMASGDANGDGVVDPSDIFYLVNYLFMGGQAPSAAPSGVSTQSFAAPMSGAVTLGEPFLRGGRYIVPVSVSATPGSEVPQAMSLRVVFTGSPVRNAIIRRAGAARDVQPSFEISRRSSNALSYLLVFNESKRGIAGAVAEIEIEASPGATIGVEVDPVLTLLSNRGGTRKASVAGGTLRVTGTTIESDRPNVPRKNQE
jgi:hypothetical protein